MKCSLIFVVAILLVVVEVVTGDHEEKEKTQKEHIEDVCGGSTKCEECVEKFFRDEQDEMQKKGEIPSPDSMYEKCKEHAKTLSENCGANKEKCLAICDELNERYGKQE